jgi:hypothetical protein
MIISDKSWLYIFDLNKQSKKTKQKHKTKYVVDTTMCKQTLQRIFLINILYSRYLLG